MRIPIQNGDHFEHDQYGDIIVRHLTARYTDFEVCDETPAGAAPAVFNGGCSGAVTETVVFVDDKRVEHTEPIDEFAVATGLLS